MCFSPATTSLNFSVLAHLYSIVLNENRGSDSDTQVDQVLFVEIVVFGLSRGKYEAAIYEAAGLTLTFHFFSSLSHGGINIRSHTLRL